MNKLKSSTILFFLLAMVACGGGGGNGSNIPGAYDVSLRLVIDDCGLNPTSTINSIHDVNMDGDIVALQAGNLSFLGQVVGDGFETFNQFTAFNGCIVNQGFFYVPPTGNGTWDVTLAQITTCPGSSMECRTAYAGIANRR